MEIRTRCGGSARPKRACIRRCSDAGLISRAGKARRFAVYSVGRARLWLSRSLPARPPRPLLAPSGTVRGRFGYAHCEGILRVSLRKPATPQCRALQRIFRSFYLFPSRAILPVISLSALCFRSPFPHLCHLCLESWDVVSQP